MILKHLHNVPCLTFNYDPAKKIKAVISVLVYSTHFQRSELLKAGEAGGFDVTVMDMTTNCEKQSFHIVSRTGTRSLAASTLTGKSAEWRWRKSPSFFPEGFEGYFNEKRKNTDMLSRVTEALDFEKACAGSEGVTPLREERRND